MRLSKFALGKGVVFGGVSVIIFYNRREATMKHRGQFPEKQRRARSKLAKIIHEQPFICGSLVTLSKLCGKPGCKCTKGEKHVSLALSVRVQGKRKMIHVPKRMEKDVQKMVERHKAIKRLLDAVSQDEVVRFLDKKAETKGRARS